MPPFSPSRYEKFLAVTLNVAAAVCLTVLFCWDRDEIQILVHHDRSWLLLSIFLNCTLAIGAGIFALFHHARAGALAGLIVGGVLAYLF